MRHLDRLTFAPLVPRVGYQDGRLPTATPSDFPRHAISNGADGGSSKFFFLPPLAKAPTYSGTFDGSLAPVVEICARTVRGCAAPVVARFTTTGGPGSERVRAVPADEHYLVNWHADQCRLDLSQTYRIRVLVDGTELGCANVKLVGKGKGRRKGGSEEFVLLSAKTLPIRFRIELVGDPTVGESAPYYPAPPEVAIPNAYLVILKDEVADVESAVERLKLKYGGEVRWTYGRLLKGFTVENLPEATLQRLLREPVILHVSQDRWILRAGTARRDVPDDRSLDRIDQLHSRTTRSNGLPSWVRVWRSTS